MYVNYNK